MVLNTTHQNALYGTWESNPQIGKCIYKNIKKSATVESAHIPKLEKEKGGTEGKKFSPAWVTNSGAVLPKEQTEQKGHNMDTQVSVSRAHKSIDQ